MSESQGYGGDRDLLSAGDTRAVERVTVRMGDRRRYLDPSEARALACDLLRDAALAEGQPEHEQPDDSEAVRIPRRLLTQLPGLLRTRAGFLRTLASDKANQGDDHDADEARTDASAMEWLRDRLIDRTRERAQQEGDT